MIATLAPITADNGQRYSAFWNQETGRVYLKLQTGAFRTCVIEASNAFTEAEALVNARAAAANDNVHWV